jgi:hypothetical protein
LVFPLRFRDLMPAEIRSRILSQLLTTAVVNIAIGLQIPQVDNWAHIGGMAGGGLVAAFLIPDILDRRPKDSRRERLLNLSACAVLALLLGTAAAQWRAPRQPLPEETLTFAPPGANPWWQIEVPKNWLKTDRGWKTPSGALLVVADSLQAPERRLELESLLAQAGKKAQRLTVGEFPAARVAIRSEGVMLDICAIEAYGQAVTLVLKCPEDRYPRALKEMDMAIANVRILRAPPAASAP